MIAATTLLSFTANSREYKFVNEIIWQYRPHLSQQVVHTNKAADSPTTNRPLGNVADGM